MERTKVELRPKDHYLRWACAHGRPDDCSGWCGVPRDPNTSDVPMTRAEVEALPDPVLRELLLEDV